uniref:Putative secreted protein n=1 Tax=Amblyomma cajennense TaxID=34607 RepID=A0A023FBS8_AMBCJ
MFVAAVICATLAVLITGDARPQPPDDIQTSTVFDDPDCDRKEGNDHVHKTCTPKCGDMLVPLNGSERCHLFGAKGTEPLIPIERTEAQTVGICRDGDCIKKPEDSQP